MFQISKVGSVQANKITVNFDQAEEDSNSPPSVAQGVLGGAFGAVGVGCGNVGGGESVACTDEIPLYATDEDLQRQSTQAVQGLREGAPVVETTVSVPGSGTGYVEVLTHNGVQLQIQATQDNGRIVANENGSFADEQGVVQFADTEGTACTETVASCSPYTNVDNSVVPLGYVRLNVNGMVILQRVSDGKLVAYGRLRDKFWSEPVQRLNYDQNGDGTPEEHFVVGHQVGRCGPDCEPETLYFETTRDGILLQDDGITLVATLEDANNRLPVYNEATGEWATPATGGLRDVTVQVRIAGGATALHPAHSYYEVTGSIDEVSSTPIAAAEQPWNQDYIFLVDPGRPLSANFTPAQLRSMAIPIENQFTIADISGRNYESQTVGADGIIDRRFYSTDGSFSLNITRRVSMGGSLDDILDSPEPQNEIVYGSADNVGLGLVCGEEAGEDAGFDYGDANDGDAGE
ncbi:hypothetical protein HZC35_03500 [Candidatus Saganbacteria bacterium]|nr:hypothetical protein [Candidatus Saganbacteria bacterium]